MRRRGPITDGTDQDGRFPPPLDDHYFDVDERSFAEILSGSAEFAKHIRFYDTANLEDGHDWSDLFAANEAAVLADILTTDPDRMQTEFVEMARIGADLSEAAAWLARFSRHIDRWRERLQESRGEAGEMMLRRIEAVIDRKLRAAMTTVREFLARQPIAYRHGDPWAGLHPLWGLAPAAYGPADREEPAAVPFYGTVDAGARERLLSAFYSLAGAVSYLKPIARETLQRSLESGEHDPAAALFIAFAKLFEKAQERANRFTARRRDFYYRDVLRVTPKPAQADHTFLVLTPQAGGTSLLIPADTAFLAGRPGPEGQPVFRTNHDLELRDARVEALCTLHCPRDPLISPERELGYVNGVRIADAIAETAQEIAGAERRSWPLFGADQQSAAMSLGSDGTVGFAVSSPALRLREGDRDIRVTVSFRLPVEPPATDLTSPEAFGRLFRRLVLRYATELEKAPELCRWEDEGGASATGWDSETVALLEQAKDLFTREAKNSFTGKDLLLQDLEYVIHRVLGTAFHLSITAAEGWQTIENCAVSISPERAPNRSRLRFSLCLGPEAPPVAAWNPAVHGPGFETNLPVLRFSLNPRATIYPYSIFNDLEVDGVEIESRVSGATRVVAWNQFGQLDPSKPFTPFGPIPTTNSYLVVGNYDCATMNVTRLAIDLEWGELPPGPEGFAEYYRGYALPCRNDSFQGRLLLLHYGRWRPSGDDDARLVPLFEGPEGMSVADRTTMEWNLRRHYQPIDPSLPEEQFHYDHKARGGFFRIDLAAPEWAFGHREYPVVLTEVLSRNARAPRWRRRAPEPLPNPPYTPVVNRLSFSWTAKSRIAVGGREALGPYTERYYRLHPFGVETVDTTKAWSMLPTIPFEGNLYIGFSSTDPAGILTLLFHLREDSATSITLAPEKVQWFYLASDTWRPLDEGRVLADTTDGFLSSGIVRMNLPGDIDRNNRTMPGNLYWVRASARRNFETFCSLYSVQTNAVSVKRELPGDGAAAFESLREQSIRGPAASIPGLRSVSQPIASLGGRQRESHRQWITRAAERLRHKARAVTPWDYERLVLEEFPEVFKVKCFAAMSSAEPRRPKPGAVLVVVVSRQTGQNPVFDPMLNAITLKRIRAFLQRHASPQATIEVRNPAYERVIVRCMVKLTQDAMRNRGIALDQLNQTLVEYISPWSSVGQKPRFGWSFKNDEVKAFVSRLPYVEFVSRFSMLHMIHVGDRYRLEDTARAANVDAAGVLKISAGYPWSIAIPNRTHILETTDDDRDRNAAPVVTGIGKLMVGDTLVI